MLNPLVIKACADELVKMADLSPELIGLLLGGAGGAGAGYKLTDDPRKKTRNAILGGLAGAAGGTLLGGELGGEPAKAVASKAVASKAVSAPATPGGALVAAKAALPSLEDAAMKDLAAREQYIEWLRNQISPAAMRVAAP